MTADWVSTGIADHHLLDEFDCGVKALNHWLVSTARRAEKQDTARTYVWTKRGDDRVVAYFAINPTRILREEDGISKSAAGMDEVPALMIAKLAVDLSIQGQGNGRHLAIDAIGRIVQAAEVSAGRLIVVDAINDAAFTFWQKLDFIPAGKTHKHRLYIKAATARAVLG